MRHRDEALAVLVRAPVGLVYLTLTDVDGWDTWWPGCRTRRSTAPPDATAAAAGDRGAADVHELVLRGGRGRGLGSLRGDLTVHGWRREEGFRAVLGAGGGVRLEWWLAAAPGGTVVHLLVSAGGPRPSRAVRLFGDGLQALKDRLELAVAVADGRVP